MSKAPKPVWLRSQDIEAVDVNRRVILLRSDKDPHLTKESELDVPVLRLNATTYKLDRARLKGQSVSVYCPVLTVF